ncbi:MAG: GNAT family N-acetyltransferase [Paracoccaceae bacterium]
MRGDFGSVTLSPTPVLDTGGLILRAPEATDWAAWLAFMQSPRSRHVRAGDMTEGQSWRAFGHVIGHWVLRGFGMFVITEKGHDAALGACGPWFPAGWPEREIGWSIWVDSAEGKGIAFEAARAVRDHVFGALGWDTAVSYIDPANTRSAALAARLGCVKDAAPAIIGEHAADVWRHPHPAVGGDSDGGMGAYA